MIKRIWDFLFVWGPRDMDMVKQEDVATIAQQYIAATQQSVKLGTQLHTRLDAQRVDREATAKIVSEAFKVAP